MQVATGVSPTAMGSNYPQYGHNFPPLTLSLSLVCFIRVFSLHFRYGHNSGNPSVQNVYHHNNSQSQVWGGDR
jgi:hypothetical protein